MRTLILITFVAIGCSSDAQQPSNTASPQPSSIACGTATCSLGTQVCCFTDTAATCVTGATCPSGEGSLKCDDSSDCLAGQVCCGEQLVNTFASYCGEPSTCTHLPSPTVCQSSADCSVDAGLTCAPLGNPSWLKACQ